jgi:hypothetical protein
MYIIFPLRLNAKCSLVLKTIGHSQSNMTAPQNNLQTLEELFQLITTLRSHSPSQEFDKLGAFFTPDCRTWLKGMREHASPAVGRQATIDKLKEMMADRYWCLDGRTVLSSSIAPEADEEKVFCETTKKLILHGKVLDPFYETEIVVFTPQGLIKDFKLYCCWSPIASLIQDITGEGPYKR